MVRIAIFACLAGIFLMPTLGRAALAPDPVDLVWIEAERFERPGGWMPDTQFIDQMGSPYLLAAGMGTPVADAATSGEWRVAKNRLRLLRKA